MRKSDGKSSVRKADLPQKECLVCRRPFSWRKKWEKVWDEVKYCSERCRGQKMEPKMSQNLSEIEVERLIRMAWEDRTPFDAIQTQFGLSEAQTIEFMKSHLQFSRFVAWRERVKKNGSLKDREARGFKLGVFKSRMQRIDGSTKK